MSYTAPIADMRFVLEEVAELDELAQLPGYEAASPDLVEAILGEAAKLAGNELAPSTPNMVARVCRSLSPSRWRRCGIPPA